MVGMRIVPLYGSFTSLANLRRKGSVKSNFNRHSEHEKQKYSIVILCSHELLIHLFRNFLSPYLDLGVNEKKKKKKKQTNKQEKPLNLMLSSTK
jgi:hypothetical protein